MHPLSSLRNYTITSRLQMNENAPRSRHDSSDPKEANERHKRLAQMRFQHQQSSARSLCSEMSMSEISMKSDNSDSKSIASSIRGSLVSLFRKGQKPLTEGKQTSNLSDPAVPKDKSDASIGSSGSTFSTEKLTLDVATKVPSTIKLVDKCTRIKLSNPVSSVTEETGTGQPYPRAEPQTEGDYGSPDVLKFSNSSSQERPTDSIASSGTSDKNCRRRASRGLAEAAIQEETNKSSENTPARSRQSSRRQLGRTALSRAASCRAMDSSKEPMQDLRALRSSSSRHLGPSMNSQKPTTDAPRPRCDRSYRSTKPTESKKKDHPRRIIRRTKSGNSGVHPPDKSEESEHRRMPSLRRNLSGSSSRLPDKNRKEELHRRAVRRTLSGNSTRSMASDQYKAHRSRLPHHRPPKETCGPSIGADQKKYHPKSHQRTQSHGISSSVENDKKKEDLPRTLHRTRSGSSTRSIGDSHTTGRRHRALRRTRSGSGDATRTPSHSKHESDHRRRCLTHVPSPEGSVLTSKSSMKDRSDKQCSARRSVSERRVSLPRSYSALHVVATPA